jgi:hypothetical protein
MSAGAVEVYEGNALAGLHVADAKAVGVDVAFGPFPHKKCR